MDWTSLPVKSKLTTWHGRLGHLNIATCRKYLKTLDITYDDDINHGWFFHACEMGKAKKIYNRTR